MFTAAQSPALRIVATLALLAGVGLTGCAKNDASDSEASDSAASDSAAANDTASADATTDSAAAGDTSKTGDAAAADATAAPKPTWYGDIAPIVANRCASCHSAGGIPPFVLDVPEAWASWGKIALISIQDGRMPPWPPAEGCGKFAHSLRMPPAEFATLTAWIDASRPLGDPKDAPADVVKPVKLTPTHTLPMPVAYTPPADVQDHYRCFLLDLDTSEELYVRGTQVIPGATALVHHVLVYALEGDMITKAEAAAAKETAPGYTCFGGPLPKQSGGILGFSDGFPYQLAAWVPGLSAHVLDKTAALRIRKGAKVVMQVHYNMSAGKTEPDITTLQLVADTTPPERVILTRPLIIETLDIPAGAKSAPHTRLYRYYGTGEVRIHSMTPHMHLLGSSFEAKVVRKDGSEECALNVPNWDFGWQLGYGRPVDEPIVLKNGDGMEIRCEYDNSVANQPWLDGKQRTPKNVAWGDGSFDEMCMLYLDTSEPFEPAPAPGNKACHGFDTCQQSCGDSAASCIFGCGDVEASCGTCAISNIISCAGLSCAGALLSAQTCLKTCLIGSLMLDSNADSCLASECGTKWTDAKKCVDPKIAKGDCDAKLAACGLKFGAK